MIAPHRRGLLAGLAVAPLVGAAVRPALARDAAPSGAALDAVFAAHRPVALAGATVTRAGLVWAAARGVRRFGGDEPVTVEDRWHLGSNTKAMTAAVFARLVQRGLAGWDMPLAEVFPAVDIHPAWQAVTLTDFMHHRAGLLDEPAMGRNWLMTARADPRRLPEQRAAIAARALGAPPGGTQGAFVYGNANYVVLGAAIEAITGGAWEDAMRIELFAPLGLTSAGFGAPGGEVGGNAWGHRGAGEQRTPMPPDQPGADNPAALGPAGTAHMDLADYGRFLAAMMGARPDWLAPQALVHLTSPPEGDPPAYACGWAVGTRPWRGSEDPVRVLGHDGSNTMWYCSVLAAPEPGVAYMAVSNEGAAGERACQTLIQALAASRPGG
ncbi:serine hydrolase domain-containing protein [Brevundimonas sp.]|uniref:serine hydrolase domain-containing protein n=1 Tax=Brevundimonas sp. TaxID=1871086 RepID=UPI0035ADEE80